MLLVTLISLSAGIVLGLRFKALVLAPAAAAVFALVFVIGMAHAETPWLFAVTLAAGIGCLQIGYFAGALIRHVLASSRTNRVRGNSLAADSR
jgi:xanthosine utilization system XapX-like protein